MSGRSEYRRVDRTGYYLATEPGEGSIWKGWRDVTLASHVLIYKEKLKNDFSCGRLIKKTHDPHRDQSIQNEIKNNASRNRPDT